MLKAIIPHIISPKPALQGRPARPAIRFVPGEIFRAVVVESNKGGEVLLEGRGARFQALTTRPLQQGRLHLFQVRAVGERVLLNVVDSHAAEKTSAVRLWASGRPLRTQLGKTLVSIARGAGNEKLDAPLKQGLELLHNRLPALVFKGPEVDGTHWLARQLKQSGLFLESLAARQLLEGAGTPLKDLAANDLKGLLLSIKNLLAQSDAPPKLTGELAEQVDRALRIIEMDQLLNLASPKEGLGWFWYIPGHTEDGFHGGEAFVRKPEAGEDELFFSLSLDFTELGRIDFSVSYASSSLGLRILVEDEDKALYVTRRLEELRAGLEEAGFEIGTMVCRERQEDDPEWSPFADSAGISGALDVVI
jgi:hypothetical protein